MTKLPGAKNQDIEFYSDTGTDLNMISDGKIISYKDFDKQTIELLRRELESDERALKCLSFIPDPAERLKRFAICRYGALNKKADLDAESNEFNDREYFDCGTRGNCPYNGEGKVCQEIIVGKEVITKQEIKIIALIAEDLTDKEIADKLFISKHTVTTHRQNITRKTGLKKAGLARWAAEHQIV